MRTRFVLYVLLTLLLSSCALLGVGNREEEEAPGVLATPYVPEGGAPPAPMLVGEDVSCTRFVAPGGDDGAPGSEAQPWGAVQHALDAAQPGDTVCFREGVYVVEDGLYLTQSGTSEAPIAFVAFPGERPVLDGGGEVGDLLTLDQGASYLRISGFVVRGFTSWGVGLDGENRYVQLDHLTVEGGEAGVHFTYGEDELGAPEGGPVEYVTLQDSLIRDCAYTAVDCTPGPCNHMIIRRVEAYGAGLGGEDSFGADGIAFARGYPVLIEDCNVHDNGGDGIDLNSRDRAGYASGVVVRRNRVVRNHQNGIKLWAGGRIENNLVWGQGNSAFWLGTFHGALEVVNNTIAYNMWDPAYSGRNWAFTAGYPEEIVARPEVELLLVNNIFAYNTGPDVGDATGIYLGPGVKLTEHHNLYYSRADGEVTAEFLDTDITRQELADGSWTERTGQGQGNVTEDPLFLSGWPAVDLNLQSESPAVGAGDAASCPGDDALGRARPADGGCDMGAFEQSE